MKLDPGCMFNLIRSSGHNSELISGVTFISRPSQSYPELMGPFPIDFGLCWGSFCVQMIITRQSEGLRSSSRVWSIYVDRPEARGTVPERFEAVREEFLMNIWIVPRIFEIFEKPTSRTFMFLPRAECETPILNI